MHSLILIVDAGDGQRLNDELLSVSLMRGVPDTEDTQLLGKLRLIGLPMEAAACRNLNG